MLNRKEPKGSSFFRNEGRNRDGEVPSQKELSSYFEELFSSKVPRQKELSSSNEELFPNPEEGRQCVCVFR